MAIKRFGNAVGCFYSCYVNCNVKGFTVHVVVFIVDFVSVRIFLQMPMLGIESF